MNLILPVAAGGALGALMRYWIGGAAQSALGPGFPFGTLFVNVTGCIAIGVLYVLLAERPDAGVWRAVLITGVLGAYTTFSAFSLETLQLLEAGEMLEASLNVLLSVGLCLAGCWAGLAVGRMI